MDFEGTAEELFEDAPCGYLIFGEDRTVARANRTLLQWLGASEDDLLGENFLSLFSAGGRIYFETHVHPLLLVQGYVKEVALDLLRKDRSRIPTIGSFALSANSDTRSYLLTLINASDRRSYERELLDARRRAESDAKRLAVLQQISADLTTAARPDDIARAVMRVTADFVDTDTNVIWWVDPTDRTLRAVSHPGWLNNAPLTDMPDGTATPHWIAITEGRLVHVRRDTAATDYPRIAERMDRLGHSAVLFVPFRRGSDLEGVMSYGFVSDRQIDPADEQMLVAITEQAAGALERAQLFERQHAITVTWQRSLLPAVLPADPRMQLEAHYEPAISDLRAGGDWYDVIRLDEDRIALFTGDVVGHGVAAAATMAQLRSAASALAHAGLAPSEVLERLDSFSPQIAGALMTTLLCAELDLRTGSLRYARAGHMPPLLVGATNEYLFDGAGPPLGILGDGRNVAEVHLSAGERLLMFTDGLIERPGESPDVGLDRLKEAASSTTWNDLEELVRQVAPTTRDDVCVLSAQVHP